jgi:tetratricopeptide (TPR) repeat protein
MTQSKIEVFTAMLAEQPDNAMIWYGLASEQYKLENWDEAVKALRQVVSLNPDYTAAYQMLGTALASNDDLAGAQKAWRDGIEAARVVPARGRPGNTCKPCWTALSATMRVSALTRNGRSTLDCLTEGQPYSEW